MKKYFLVLFLTLLIVYYASSISAAGSNKVIVDNLSWQISETAHFRIYHYKQSEPILPLIAHHLEQAYKKVIRDFDYEPKEKTPFFFYLTHNHFEQTNIVDVDEGTGGVAEAFKNRFLIPYSGSEKELEYVLTHEFTHILTFNILYGSGFWKSLRLLKTPVYPLWMMEGIAEYEGGENDATTREMYLCDATLNENLIPLYQLHSFNHLKPHQVVLAYKEAESVLHFIAEEYGEEKVPELFFEFLDKLDISSVLITTLGLDLFILDRKWREYLEDRYLLEVIDRKEPCGYGKKLTTRPSSGNLYDFNTNAVWSPDGKKIAFLSDRNGQTELYLMDKDGKNLKRIVGIKNREKIDLIQRNYRSYLGGNDLSFSPDGRWLAFVGEKNEQDYLFLYDLKRKKLKKIDLLTLGKEVITSLETISQPSFSPDGKNIVFVGMKGGINDLYLYELKKKKLVQLNADSNDDRAPLFSPAESAGKWIVFSQEKNKQYDLCLLNLETKEIHPLTNLPGDEIMPSFSPDGKKVIFVADPEGIYDLYLIDLETKEIEQLTKITGGIFTPQFSPDGKEILFTAFSKGEMNIYCGARENFAFKGYPLVSKVFPIPSREEAKTFLSESYPYRTRFSTDLFLPVFWFSTEGGFISAYWQISEYLGNHQLSTTFNYSEPGTVLEYQLNYSYRRWRPQLGISFVGSSYVEEGTKNYLYGCLLPLSYPLDRFNRFEIVSTFYRIKTLELNLFSESKLNLLSISYIRDTLEGKYLEPRFGSLVNLTYTSARKNLGSDFTFEKYFFYWQKVLPLFGLKSRFHSLVLRGLTGSIKGPNVNEEVVEKFFWPEYLIRGYGDIKEKNLGLFTLEFRFPIFADINYHFWYIIPDLFFKYLGGVIFTDFGYAWKNWGEIKNLKLKDLMNSAGIGLRLNLFILQTYPLTLGLDWAKRTDSKDEKWHFYLLPTFYLDVVFGKNADVRR